MSVERLNELIRQREQTRRSFEELNEASHEAFTRADNARKRLNEASDAVREYFDGAYAEEIASSPTAGMEYRQVV